MRILLCLLLTGCGMFTGFDITPWWGRGDYNGDVSQQPHNSSISSDSNSYGVAVRLRFSVRPDRVVIEEMPPVTPRIHTYPVYVYSESAEPEEDEPARDAKDDLCEDEAAQEGRGGVGESTVQDFKVETPEGIIITVPGVAAGGAGGIGLYLLVMYFLNKRKRDG
jgi:hypothetical protein